MPIPAISSAERKLQAQQLTLLLPEKNRDHGQRILWDGKQFVWITVQKTMRPVASELGASMKIAETTILSSAWLFEEY